VVSSAGDDDRAWLGHRALIIGRIVVPGKPVSSRIPAKGAVPLP